MMLDLMGPQANRGKLTTKPTTTSVYAKEEANIAKQLEKG